MRGKRGIVRNLNSGMGEKESIINSRGTFIISLTLSENIYILCNPIMKNKILVIFGFALSKVFGRVKNNK